MKLVAVTGCLGFLGTHLVEALCRRGYYVYGYDAETYAANLDWLDTRRGFSDIFRYQKADICTLGHLPDVDAVINLAAETHVDNSTMDATAFVRTNYTGVHHLLELVRGKRNFEMPRFVQISTDEVYGDITKGETDETAPLNPSSPYAASKAAADFLVQAYARTHGLRYQIIRPSNLYGQRQFPEKLIPKAVRYFKLGKKMPVHKGGCAYRSWLAVEDCAEAIITVLESGIPNTVYNVGGNTDASVGEIVQKILELTGSGDVDYRFERSGLDERYHVNDDRLQGLGWMAKGDFWRDLPKLVEAERKVFRW